MFILLSFSFILTTACHKSNTSQIAQLSTQQTTPNISFIEQWKGRINTNDQASPNPTLMIIKNQMDLDKFTALIPTHVIQKQQPAPKSSDPFLDGISIDFDHEMLLVSLRTDSMYVYSPIVEIEKGDPHTVAHIQIEPIGETAMYASQHGIGTYSAVKIKRIESEFRIQLKP